MNIHMDGEVGERMTGGWENDEWVHGLFWTEGTLEVICLVQTCFYRWEK